jgi:predicted DNA-binding transcriptional regulator AlpA
MSIRPSKLSVPVVPAVPTSPIDPSQILTLDETAARLKTSRRWVYEKSRRRCQDPLPVIRIGRYLRFNWLDVSEWLRQHTNMSAPSGRRAQ